MFVPVYIIRTGICININALKNFFKFSDKNRSPCETLTFKLIDKEFFTTICALKHAQKHFPKHYIITIEDTSITSSNADILAQLICKAIKIKTWNIAYLANWLDRCDLYQTLSPRNNSECSNSECSNSECSNLKFSNSEYSNSECSNSECSNLECSNNLIHWVKTYSPNGTQSLLWSPKTVKIILGLFPIRCNIYFDYKIPLALALNQYINNGYLKAITTTPPFFTFDPTLATNINDFNKLTECSLINNTVNEEPNRPISLVIFIMVVTLIISLGWIAYVFWGKYYS
jgi:hypothetical protein